MSGVSSLYGPGVYTLISLAWSYIMFDIYRVKTLIISHISGLCSRSGKNAKCLPQSPEWPEGKFLEHLLLFLLSSEPRG